jgi:hypothetical protein
MFTKRFVQNAFHNFIHNCPKLEIAQMSINTIDKVFNGMLIHNEKEQITDTCNKIMLMKSTLLKKVYTL